MLCSIKHAFYLRVSKKSITFVHSIVTHEWIIGILFHNNNDV